MNMIKFSLAMLTVGILPTLLADLAYLETDGTAYIDTGVPGIMNVRAKIKLYIPSKPTSSTWRIFGCRHDYETSENTWMSLFELSSQQFLAYSFKGYRNPTTSIKFPFGEWKEWESQCKKGSQWSKFDNGEAFVSSAENGQVSYTGSARTLHLFKVDNRGSFADAENCEAGTRVASLQIWANEIGASDETLVRDFVPAKDQSGKACLYDNVEKKYYYSETGSGLSYGEEHVAAQLTWTGAGDGVCFSDGSNWDTGNPPASGDSLLFPKTLTGDLTVTNDIAGLAVQNLLLANRGTLRISQAKPLTINGEIVSSSKAGRGLVVIMQ